MEKSEFRKPLIQSAAIVTAIFILFALISASSTGGVGAGIMALFSGIGNLILFFIGLAIALPFSIAVVIGIFLGAVALYSKETSVQMYSDLKKNFSENIITLKDKWSCCERSSNSAISEGGTKQLQQEMVLLEGANTAFNKKIQNLEQENSNLKSNLAVLGKTNSSLKQQLGELGQTVDNLENSTQVLQDITSSLDSRIEAGFQTDLHKNISDLQLKLKESEAAVSAVSERLGALEKAGRQSPAAGIFSYIESQDDQNIFAATAEEAVSQELTYAQIDAYFTEHLGHELDKIAKDHPSLTKTYIRNLKRE
ncbi:MAG: hypothetical protein JRJ68_03645 [Deltaproteobacteria bacterium]|nr:hypothetical protein [Deltaproteobacteria bacterium]